MLAETVSADWLVSQVVRQQVPHQRASHGESPPGKCTPPLLRYAQQSSTSRSEMTPWRCSCWGCRSCIIGVCMHCSSCCSQCSSSVACVVVPTAQITGPCSRCRPRPGSIVEVVVVVLVVSVCIVVVVAVNVVVVLLCVVVHTAQITGLCSRCHPRPGSVAS